MSDISATEQVKALAAGFKALVSAYFKLAPRETRLRGLARSYRGAQKTNSYQPPANLNGGLKNG